MRKRLGKYLPPVPIRALADVEETGCGLDGIGPGSCSVTAFGISDFRPSYSDTK